MNKRSDVLAVAGAVVDPESELAAHNRKDAMIPMDASPSQAEAAGGITDVAALAARASCGERGAFEQLVDHFQTEIFRMVYYRTRSRMDAEDLTQEIFMQAYRHVIRLQNPERFRPWLFTIATNRVRDFLRRRRFLAFLGTVAEDGPGDIPDYQMDAAPGGLEQLIQQEFWTELQRLAAQLSRWEREVFFLRFLDQLNLREIAEVLNKSESAVKTHLYRALEKFKENREIIELLRGASA